jgi:hypothetical protein
MKDATANIEMNIESKYTSMAAADQAFLAEQERQARERQEEEQERAQAGVAEGAGLWVSLWCTLSSTIETR